MTVWRRRVHGSRWNPASRRGVDPERPASHGGPQVARSVRCRRPDWSQGSFGSASSIADQSVPAGTCRGDPASQEASVGGRSHRSRDRLCELIHVNIKKLAAIPHGGGWPATDEATTAAAHTPEPATATSTQRSMTVPGASIPSSTTTNKHQPPPSSGSEPITGSTKPASPRTRHHRQRIVLAIPPLAALDSGLGHANSSSARGFPTDLCEIVDDAGSDGFR